MTRTNDGRYCSSCQKTVTDFTAMNNQQIIEYLSSAKDICGRISVQQFNSVNYQLQQDNLPKASLWKRMMLAVTMLASVQYVKGQAAPIRQDTTQSGVRVTVGEVVIAKPSYRTITGKVTDAKGEALPGVYVLADNNKTVTDTNGQFTMQVSLKAKKLRVSYIGFETQEIKIDKTVVKPFKIILKESTMMLGGLGTIKKQSLLKKIYQRNIVEPFKALLG